MIKSEVLRMKNQGFPPDKKFSFCTGDAVLQFKSCLSSPAIMPMIVFVHAYNRFCLCL